MSGHVRVSTEFHQTEPCCQDTPSEREREKEREKERTKEDRVLFEDVLTGRTTTLDVECSDTNDNNCSQIQRQFGMLVAQQRLMFLGRQLVTGKILFDFIFMVPRLREGATLLPIIMVTREGMI